MNNYLKSFLIFLLCSFAEGYEHTSDSQCVQLKNFNLRIPNNAIAQGEGRGNASWYRHVNWADTPAGHLTLHYVRDIEESNGWRTVTATASASEVNRPDEESDWEEFVKGLLGLTYTFVKIPGRVRAPQTIFDEGQACTSIRFEETLSRGRYRVFLHYEDDDGNKVLDGQVLFTK